MRWKGWIWEERRMMRERGRTFVCCNSLASVREKGEEMG
jgi:hypothetical protein